MKCAQWKDTNFIVYMIIALFGSGTWIAVTGIWVELPLIVPELPESWRLPSFLSIIVQIANVGPIAFTLANYFLKDRINDRILIYVLIAINIVAFFVLGFFWKVTATVAGEDHSIVLFVIMFLSAFVSCSSSVVFIPFMAIFKSQYLSAFFIGQGLSGLIPSLVALGQGVGQLKCVNSSVTNNHSANISTLTAVYEEPNFSIDTFLFTIFFMLCVCGICFTLMLYLPLCKREYAKEKTAEQVEMDLAANQQDTKESSKKQICSVSGITVSMLMLNAWINFLWNGFLLPTQTYSCLPYGNEVYHLTATLVNIASPVSSLMTFVFPSTKKGIIMILTTVATMFAAYTLFISVSSPAPILLHEVSGPVLIIIAWVVTAALLTFSKVAIATVLRKRGKSALRWYGIATQAGSLVGTVIMYCLVNVANVFQSAPACV